MRLLLYDQLYYVPDIIAITLFYATLSSKKFSPFGRPVLDDYYRDTCKIRKADMIAFLKANSIYNIKPSLSQTTAKVKIVAGAKEQKNIRDSAELLHQAIPESSMEILSGLRHGDLSINHPQNYRRMLTEWIGR